MHYKRTYAKAFAPASVSNVGPGFDIFGFPVYGLGDYVEVTVSPVPGVRITAITGNNALSLDTRKNTAGKAASTLLNAVNASFGVDLVLRKQLPIGSGLGSSAAGAAAAVLAVNHLFEYPLSKHELLPFALDGEAITSGGVRHGDNVFPSLIGGFMIIRAVDPPAYTVIPCPADLCCVCVHPHIEISTAFARGILPKEFPLASGVRQAANAASMVAGLLFNDDELIASSLHDQFAEPYRKNLIPYYDIVTLAAREAGALGANISGSGPTIFALCKSEATAAAVAEAMVLPYDQNGLECDVHISTINTDGAVIEEDA